MTCARSGPGSAAPTGERMTTSTTSRSAVLADPVGVVVDLVTVAEPGLDRAMVADIVARVAGGRAKRRRLAQALCEQPTLLVEGRSPAPRVVGDLLLALRAAGAVAVSPRSARSAARRCAACSAAARTGTAGAAGRGGNPAWPAATPGR